MPKGVFDVSVLGIRTSRFSTTLNSVEHLKTVEIYPIGHQPLKGMYVGIRRASNSSSGLTVEYMGFLFDIGLFEVSPNT